MIELLVSVSVLVGIMVMVSTIFSTATRAGGQATASATIYRHLRQTTEMIHADLAGCDPTAHALSIVGQKIAAYRTPKDQASGRKVPDPKNPENDWHRADILTFFTRRSVDPSIFEQPEDPDSQVKFDEVVQVCYGHADFGKLNADGKTWASASKLEDKPPPASKWHLARRVVLFPQDANPGGTGVGPTDVYLTDLGFLEGQYDLFGEPMAVVQNEIAQGFFHFNGINPVLFYGQDPTNNAMFRYDSGGWLLFSADHWWGWIGSAWQRDQYDPAADPPKINPVLNPPSTPYPTSELSSFFNESRLWFYDAGGARTRTLLDPAPPVGADQRVGVHFLPGCCAFRVEYTYDDPRELLLDGDGKPVIQHPIRWQRVPPGEQMIWSRLSVNPTEGRAFPYRWPSALRITITAYDPAGRLESPIEQPLLFVWQ